MKATYISHMGTDLTVVNAARVSFNKVSKLENVPLDGWDGSSQIWSRGLSEKDSKLIKYLANHGHWTPFSHPQITMVEKVPVIVARQRFKHMVGFTYNEVSRRYVDEEPEFYVPTEWRSRPEGSVKQGSGEVFDEDKQKWLSRDYSLIIEEMKKWYGHLIAAGVAPEQARMVLPQSMYTEYWVTGSLAAWARAYKQRSDSSAQLEIQELAKQWDSVIRPLFPISWRSLTE